MSLVINPSEMDGISVNSQRTQWAEVDEQGRLVLPAEVAARYGLAPGAKVRLEDNANAVSLHRPVIHLAKIYDEHQ